MFCLLLSCASSPRFPRRSLLTLEVQPDTCSAVFILLERILMRFFCLAGSVIRLGNALWFFLRIFEQWFRPRSL